MHIGKALDENDMKRVTFLLPEDLVGFLDGYTDTEKATEKTVKGYTVRSRIMQTNPADAIARRRSIAQVVARSIGSLQ